MWVNDFAVSLAVIVTFQLERKFCWVKIHVTSNKSKVTKTQSTLYEVRMRNVINFKPNVHFDKCGKIELK